MVSLVKLPRGFARKVCPEWKGWGRRGQHKGANSSCLRFRVQPDTSDIRLGASGARRLPRASRGDAGWAGEAWGDPGPWG